MSPENNQSDSPEKEFRARLLGWYDAHARDLPWRKSHDPYRVWVSEIMLQQTRVAAVIEHYHRFLRRFPTVEKLAAAREATVLAAWSGLGYYRRARMLHAAAKVVARERKGTFPGTAADWRELPGIGRYTSAAIASIAFGEATAVVDGNVERVLQRLSGERLAGEKVWHEAERFLDRQRPGDFNQAMMELGATVCTPRAPTCLMCPIVDLCATRGEMAALAKAAPQQKRQIDYSLGLRDGAVFLVRRASEESLMAGMWELPQIETSHPPGEKLMSRSTIKERATRKKKSNGVERKLLFRVKHSITQTDYSVGVWAVGAFDDAVGKWVPTRKLPAFALTGLARKILRKAGCWPERSGESGREGLSG